MKNLWNEASKSYEVLWTIWDHAKKCSSNSGDSSDRCKSHTLKKNQQTADKTMQSIYWAEPDSVIAKHLAYYSLSIIQTWLIISWLISLQWQWHPLSVVRRVNHCSRILKYSTNIHHLRVHHTGNVLLLIINHCNYDYTQFSVSSVGLSQWI